MKWAIHLFAREKVVDINAPTDMPSVDEVLRSLGSAVALRIPSVLEGYVRHDGRSLHLAELGSDAAMPAASKPGHA